MSFIQQFFTSRDNNANAETFVGQEGRLWWDPVTNQIYSSDGSTPGGIPLAGGGGGNGTPGGSNSQVQFNNSGTFGGSANLTFNRVNGALTAVSFVGDGAGLSNITGANVVGEVTNATYASSAVTAINAETVTANAQPNINSLGILTELSATGNVTGNYFIGNGSLLTGISSGSSNTIFNGNSNVAIATTNGNVTITANTSQPYTWTFDTSGELLLAGNIVGSGNTTIKADNNNAWISQAAGDSGFSQLYWTNDIANADPYDGNGDFAWAYVDNSGFFVTSRTVEPARSYNWDFRGSDGTLITPGKFITPVGNTSAKFDFRVDGDGGGSDLEFGADAPGSQYFLASVQDPVGRAAEFWLNAVDEGNINAQIRTFDGMGTTMQWDFNANGDLILPGNTAYIGADASQISIYSDINSETAGMTVVTNSVTSIFNEAAINLTTNIADVPRQWQFDQTGNLTIPGSIILPTLGSIMTSGYNNPELLTANADSNWAYGFSSDNVANYYTQVKFFGDHSTTRGFKILDSDSGNAWLFNGNGGLTFPDATIQTTAFTGTATTVTANAQANITSVGTLTVANISGEMQLGNFSGNRFRILQDSGALYIQGGNGIASSGASVIFAPWLNSLANATMVVDIPNRKVAIAKASPSVELDVAGAAAVSGNITGGNLLTGGIISSTGNATVANISATIGAFTTFTSAQGGNVTGTLIATSANAQFFNQTNPAGYSTVAGYLSVAGNITGSGNIIGNGYRLTSVNASNVSGTVAAASVAYSLPGGTAGALVVQNAPGATGFITIAAANTILTSDGSSPAWTLPSSIAVGTVTANAQPNITSVGTLTSVTVSGNTSSGNLLTGGLISATGNIDGGNINTAGAVRSTGSMSVVRTTGQQGEFTFTDGVGSGFVVSVGTGLNTWAGAGSLNLITSSSPGANIGFFVAQTERGRFTSSGLSVAGTVSATGNITGGNINTAGRVSATGNINGNNIIAVGTISATGGTNGTAFAVGNSAVSNVALGLFPTAGTPGEFAIRDYSTVTTNMYFDVGIGGTANGQFTFRTTNSYSTLANVNIYGITLTTNRPAFRVYGSGTTNNLTTTQNSTGALNGNNWTADYTQGSGLNSTTGVFTAPVAGLYQINAVGRNSGFSGGISQLAVVKNATGGTGSGGTVQLMIEWAASSSMNHVGSGTVARLAVNDTLALKVLAGQINFDSNDNWSVAYLG